MHGQLLTVIHDPRTIIDTDSRCTDNYWQWFTMHGQLLTLIHDALTIINSVSRCTDNYWQWFKMHGLINIIFYAFISTENPAQHVLHSVFTCQHACRTQSQYLLCTDYIFNTKYFLCALLVRWNLCCAVLENSGKQWAKTDRVNFNPQEGHILNHSDSLNGRNCVCVCRSWTEVNTKLLFINKTFLLLIFLKVAILHSADP
jgi:hypothetical protein